MLLAAASFVHAVSSPMIPTATSRDDQVRLFSSGHSERHSRRRAAKGHVAIATVDASLVLDWQ